MPPRIPRIQSAPLPLCPFAPAAQTACLACLACLAAWVPFASLTQRSRLDFQQPNQGPRLPRGGQLTSITLAPRANQPVSHPASQPFVLSCSRTQGHLSPRAPMPVWRPATLQRCSLFVALPACLPNPRPSAPCRRGRSSTLHTCTNISIDVPCQTWKRWTHPSTSGTHLLPLPLAKHVSNLQGVPRGCGECHPLASPDRMAHPRHDIVAPDTQCPLRPSLQQTKATKPVPSITSAVLRGRRPTSLSLTAGPFPLSHGRARIVWPPATARHHR